MRVEATVAEVMDVMRGLDQVPPFIQSVEGTDDEIHVAIDLRQAPKVPSPVKLAAKFAPIMRAKVKLESFDAGVATAAVDANAGGLPANKLFSFAEAPLAKVLAAQKLPPDSVRILPNARVAVDLHAVIAAKYPALAGLRVTELALSGGQLRAAATI